MLAKECEKERKRETQTKQKSGAEEEAWEKSNFKIMLVIHVEITRAVGRVV